MTLAKSLQLASMAQSGGLGKRETRCHIEDMTDLTRSPAKSPRKSLAKPTAAPSARPPADGEPGPREIGGPKGPEPTRYGDWEVNGRCSDF